MQSFSGFVFGRRGASGLPLAAKLLPSRLLTWVAKRRRAAGFYDWQTLALFRYVWRRSTTPAALLDYALFRRDLGHVLPQSWAASMAASFSSLNEHGQRLAYALLKEVGRSPEIQALDRTNPSEKQLAKIQAHQNRWRREFTGLMRQKASSGICVVGNSWKLLGSRLGDFIDDHAMVVRFNRFRNENSSEVDIGNRMGVWVVASGYSDSPPPSVKWVVVSGPDMQFRLQSWKHLLPALSNGASVLSVPLPPWRRLVEQLQAPPSAGVLFLFWLRSMLGSWSGVTSVGFGLAASATIPYHHADQRQQPVQRHNWKGERLLLHQWKSEGLKMEGGF